MIANQTYHFGLTCEDSSQAAASQFDVAIIDGELLEE